MAPKTKQAIWGRAHGPRPLIEHLTQTTHGPMIRPSMTDRMKYLCEEPRSQVLGLLLRLQWGSRVQKEIGARGVVRAGKRPLRAAGRFGEQARDGLKVEQGDMMQ